MPSLPDLTQLSHAQKDELIRMLWPLQQQVQELMEQMVAMQERIRQLEGRLAKNSKNSSKPPSTDGLTKPAPKSLREPGLNPNGGQKGHGGATLRQSAQIDETVNHLGDIRCAACQREMVDHVIAETRQVLELPKLGIRTVAHQQWRCTCTCGAVHLGGLARGRQCAGTVRRQRQSHGRAFEPAPPGAAGAHRAAHARPLWRAPVASQPPKLCPGGGPGRLKQSKAANLLKRLREHRHEVWRFMTDVDVPFTNNLAEQALRMAKVKQKISGCFRTEHGAATFFTIRSYLATMTKQKANLFDCLVSTFNRRPVQPCFSG